MRRTYVLRARPLADRKIQVRYCPQTDRINFAIDCRLSRPRPTGTALKEKSPRALLRRRYLTVIALRIACRRRGGLLSRARRKTCLQAEHRTGDRHQHYRFDHRPC
jgi:hypothetical protein